MKNFIKNIFFLGAFLLINSSSPMNLDRPNSLLSIFGISEKYNDLPEELGKTIALHVTAHQWWYPHKELQLSDSIGKKQKISKAIVRFSPSGNKIGITNSTSISMWNTHQDAVESLVEFPNTIEEIQFNKDETKIFGSGINGLNVHMFFRDLTLKDKQERIGESARAFSLETVTSSDYVLSDDGTKAILGSWNRAILVNTVTGEVEKVLWQTSDQNNHNKVRAFFVKDTSTVHVIHNGFLSTYEDSEQVQYKAILPADTYLPLYSPEKIDLFIFITKKIR